MNLNWVNRKNALSLVALLALVILAIGLIIRYAGNLKPKASTAMCKYLISYDRDGGASPTYLAGNLNRIESMTNFPYNGVTILESNAGSVMTKNVITYDMINNNLADLRNMATKPTKVKNNFIRVLLNDPGDMFDDAGWNQAAKNFTALGQALQNLKTSGFGIEGVLFDNEGPYGATTCSTGDTRHGLWNLPVTSAEQTEFTDHKDCWPYIRNWATHKQADYNAKAIERGRQMMSALAAGWPDVKLMFMHSPDVSCSNMDGIVRQNDVAYANDMLGPFAVGLAEGAPSSAKVIDGGEESYGYTTDSLFSTSYNLRDSGMVTTYLNDCSFIPTADRDVTVWKNLYDIGFALYNKVHGLGGGQDTSTIGTATQLALNHSDNFVWFYTENVSSIDPNKSNYIGSAWMTPIISGRNAVPNDPTCGTSTSSPTPSTSPSVTTSPTPSTSPSLCEPTAPSNLTAVAPSSTQVNVTWQDNSTNENGFSLERKLSTETSYTPIYNTYSSNVTSYNDTNVVAGKTYNYRVRGYNGCGTGVSAYSNIATVTVPYGICEPTAPSGLTAKANTSSKITITWQDNSSNENGFAIERSTSPTSGFVQIASVGANIKTFADTGLQRSTTYYYRVRAFNACGTGISSYSNTASAKTKRWWVF